MNSAEQDVWYGSISDRVTKKKFRPGDIISMQGEVSGFVGYILSGTAKAVSFSERGDATWVGYFKADDFFGHTSLLTKSHSQFEISAENEVEAIII